MSNDSTTSDSIAFDPYAIAGRPGDRRPRRLFVQQSEHPKSVPVCGNYRSLHFSRARRRSADRRLRRLHRIRPMADVARSLVNGA